MRIGLLSDTHGFLDEAILTHFAACDEVWHAGDVGSIELLERLESYKPLRAVYGNIDDSAIQSRLAGDLDWTCEGVRVYMTHIHDAGASKQIAKRKPDVFVCGHSHILKVTAGKPIYLNPGACGHQGWHKIRTVLRFTLDPSGLSDLEAIELGPRGRKLRT